MESRSPCHISFFFEAPRAALAIRLVDTMEDPASWQSASSATFALMRRAMTAQPADGSFAADAVCANLWLGNVAAARYTSETLCVSNVFALNPCPEPYEPWILNPEYYTPRPEPLTLHLNVCNHPRFLHLQPTTSSP